MSRKYSPLPTEDLNDGEAWPFRDGVDQMTIRVSRYEADGTTPACYQCLARGKGRDKRSGLGMRPSVVLAIHDAVNSFFQPPTDTLAKKAEPSVSDLLG